MHARSCAHFSHALWASDGQTAAGLVSALQTVALSGRPGHGLKRHGWRIAVGAGNGSLTVSKMPVKEASAVIERLTGVKLPPATLDREARRQGQRADRKRKQLDEQMQTGQGLQKMLPGSEKPFTLVIELDTWNIRERD